VEQVKFVICNQCVFSGHFSRWTWVSRYQNVSIVDFVGAKGDGDGDDNWSYKTCKAPVKSLPPTNPTPSFLQAKCPSCHPSNSVKTLKQGKQNISIVHYMMLLMIIGMKEGT